MNNTWKELKDTLLNLYRRCYEYDKKYREYLESTHSLQDLEDYRNSFSDHRPAPYFVLQHIKDLSEEAKRDAIIKRKGLKEDDIPHFTIGDTEE